MPPMSKISVEQLEAAISLLNTDEKQRLLQYLAQMLRLDLLGPDSVEWTQLAESSLQFWLDEEEDIYVLEQV